VLQGRELRLDTIDLEEAKASVGSSRHARESGHPGGADEWIPASAGMTNGVDPKGPC
jgi:hypothetical protein